MEQEALYDEKNPIYGAVRLYAAVYAACDGIRCRYHDCRRLERNHLGKGL